MSEKKKPEGKSIAIRVPDAVHAAYKAAAKAQGTTLGKWLRGACDARLNAEA